MKRIICLQDGHPYEHTLCSSSLSEDDFKQAFPDVDTKNLPPEFAWIVRAEPPVVGPYEKHTVSYQLVDGVYTDVFACEQMTAEEIAAKQRAVKDTWAENNGFTSWIFNESTCSFESPIKRPTDGAFYKWDEPTLSWVRPEAVETVQNIFIPNDFNG